MVMTGFLRVLASGVPLLLLAMRTTTTTTYLVQRAGAPTSSELTDAPVTGYTTDGTTTTAEDGSTEEDAVTADKVVEACTDAISACDVDDTCSICVTASSSSKARLECHRANSLPTSAASCETNMESACCLDELTDLDCLDNGALLGFLGACWRVWASSEVPCDGDDDGDGGTVDTASDGATGTIAAAGLGHASTATVVVGVSCAFMVLWPLLWV